jgi:hypothetical protein
MRWVNPEAKEGDCRDRSGFLWTRKTNIITKETRWLEFASWREVYTSSKNGYYWAVVWWHDQEGITGFLLTT